MRSVPSLRYTLPIVAILLIALFIVSCGSSNGNSSYGNTGGSGSTPAATSTDNSGAYGKSYSNSTPTTAPNASGVVIHTTKGTVNGTSEIILTSLQGMTLYYFTPDTKTTSACTGGCAGTWPALITKSSSAPTSAGPLPGKLNMQMTTNGNQV